MILNFVYFRHSLKKYFPHISIVNFSNYYNRPSINSQNILNVSKLLFGFSLIPINKFGRNVNTSEINIILNGAC